MTAKKYLTLAGTMFIALGGVTYSTRNTDTTKPCVEVKVRENALELEISDSNSTCTAETRTPFDTRITYTRPEGISNYSNITQIQLLVNGEYFTNIPLPVQGPNIHSSIPIRLPYGEHTLEVHATDEGGNRGTASILLFAYEDRIQDVRIMEKDRSPPELGTARTLAGKTTIARDYESGIKKIDLSNKEGESLLSQTYTTFTQELPLEELIKNAKRGQKGLLTIVVEDHSGNRQTQTISYPQVGKGPIGGY